MKWKTDTSAATAVKSPAGGPGGRYGKRGEVVQTGVFRPLSDYNESWSPPADVTVSGVFRPLSEDGPIPTKNELPSPTTKIYIGTTESTTRIESHPPVAERYCTRITTGEAYGHDVSGKGADTSVYHGAELSKHSGVKKSDSSFESKRGSNVCDSSGESAQLTYRSPTRVSSGKGGGGVAGNRSSYAKLDSASSTASSSSSTGDSSQQQGMHPAARDTGQQRGATSLSRASSPGSSSGSSYNLSNSTDTTADSRGLRATPMGSTTGLLPDSSACSQSKLKVDGGCMPGLSATLTILSLAASLGNVLRLPRVVLLSGGGTFLIVYICISLVFGIPLVFLEIGLGQFCQEGTTKLWRAVPLFKGVGYVKVLASGLISIYYPVLMGLSLFYMVWCAKGPIPFIECTPSFATMTGEVCLKQTFLKSVNMDAMWFGVSVAFLFLLWALFMLCIFKSDNSYRASVYFFFTPILVCLIALLVESILKDKAVYGLQKLVTFHWESLLDLKLWYFAIVQMFFSTQLGFGSIVTCAGSLYSKSNALWSAVVYVILNLVIGVLAVCLVYQWIGRNATSISSFTIPESIVYTITYDAASEYVGDLKQLWPSLMFLVIICTGFAAMVAALYTILVAITLEINKKCSWWLIAGCICTVGFLAGILCIIPENLEIVHILDHYVVGRIVIASTALELIAFAWIYGCNTLYNDFEFVLGRQLNPIWKIMWTITPFLLILVEIWSMVSLPRTGLPDRPSDPMWVYTTGWVLYLLTWVIVISAGIHQIKTQVDYNLSQKFLSTLKPSRNWGPVDTIYRHWWVQWRVTCTKTGERDFTFKRRGTKDYTSSVQKYNTTDAVGTYRATPSSANGTLQHNRAKDRGPFTIQTNGNLPEHVCWRGSLQRHDGT